MTHLSFDTVAARQVMLQDASANADEDLEALAQLAAEACEAAGALICVGDGGAEGVVSRSGAVAQTPDSHVEWQALAASSRRFLAVPDVHLDPAFVSLAERCDPPVRSFAVAPVTFGDNSVRGAICVLDTEPREYNDRVERLLCGIARQVYIHMALRHHADALEDALERLRTAEETIRHLAHHDALTGLPGRMLFRDRLEHALHHALRYDETLAVMFIDLDGFKAVNDTHGHAAGDVLLQSVAAGLNAALRRSDTVARVGGDEFAVVCPDLHDPDDAVHIATKLLEAVRACAPGLDVVVTASIGIAIYPYDGATAETLLCDADAAMYRAKRRGRNQYAFGAIVGRKGKA